MNAIENPPASRDPGLAGGATSSRLDFVDHLLIIRALILRDLRLKYQNGKFGFILAFLRPTIVVIAHYYWFLLLRRRMPGDIPIATFVIAGFSVWFAFYGAAQGAINGANPDLRPIYMPGVTTMHRQLARAIWGWLVNVIFCLFATIPLNIYGAGLPLPNFELTFLIFVVTGCLGFGFGVTADQFAKIWPATPIFEKLLTWALFITSGLYFSISTVYRPIAVYVWYNPIIHLVEFERHAFVEGYPVALVNLAYPAAIAFGLTMVGLILAQNSRHALHA